MASASIRSCFVSLIILGLSLTGPVAGAKEDDSTATHVESSEAKVQENLGERLVARRIAMMEEAHTALDMTKDALAALDAGDTQQALDALASATGKLELIVARDPGLALAPVDVRYVTHDVYATPEGIRKARQKALDLLEEGRVQEARAILSGLASEIIIRVTNLPLGTYPNAIKAISPLIDEGEIVHAKRALQAALNTLVVTDQVISLPALRASYLLAEAQQMLNDGADSESGVNAEQISRIVAAAREQVEMAELLGYGNDAQFAEFRKQLDDLQARIGGDQETDGAFAALRKSLDGFQTSLFE